MTALTCPEIYFFSEDVVRILQRHSLHLEDALSFDKVKNYISLKELAKLNHLSNALHSIGGMDHCEAGACFTVAWLQSVVDAKAKQQIAMIDAMQREEGVLIEIRDDLFNPNRKNKECDGRPYEVKLFGANKAAITISNGMLSDPQRNVEISRSLVRDIVKALYVYEDYGSVISRPIGLRYLEQLFN